MLQVNEKRVSTLRVGRTEHGFLVRVEGRGTVKLSPLLQQFAIQSFDARSDEPKTIIAVDLSACVYLDSTFLGCLLNLNRRYNRADPRFLVVAPPEKRRALLETSNLNRVLDIRDEGPEPSGEMVELTCPDLLGADLGRHVLECHRQLAQLDGPEQSAFLSIVDRLDQELSMALAVRGL